MKKRDRDRMSDELLQALQQGDPAGEGGLQPAERDRIRRQILAAAEVPGRRWSPVVRTLGYAAAGLAAVLGGWLALQNLPQRTGTLSDIGNLCPVAGYELFDPGQCRRKYTV